MDIPYVFIEITALFPTIRAWNSWNFAILFSLLHWFLFLAKTFYLIFYAYLLILCCFLYTCWLLFIIDIVDLLSISNCKAVWGFWGGEISLSSSKLGCCDLRIFSSRKWERKWIPVGPMAGKKALAKGSITEVFVFWQLSLCSFICKWNLNLFIWIILSSDLIFKRFLLMTKLVEDWSCFFGKRSDLSCVQNTWFSSYTKILNC